MKKILIVVGIVLLFITGNISGAYLEKVFHKCPEIQYQELTEWQVLEMAIIKTESEFNDQALGKKNDIGIFQITPVYVKEVNRILDSTAFNHVDAFSVEKSLEMFNIVQDSRNPEHDVEKAIQIHNPNGKVIDYTNKVLSNFKYIKRYENVRKTVINDCN